MAQFWAYQFGDAYQSFKHAATVDRSFGYAGAWEALSLVGGFSPSPYLHAVARQAIRAATAHLSSATSSERDFVSAIRPCVDAVVWNAHTCLQPFQTLKEQHPNDESAVMLWVSAGMWLNWFNLYSQPGRRPLSPLTGRLIAATQDVLRRDPSNPAALHMYIHELEQSPDPRGALDAARKLPRVGPDAEHYVHMPAHVYTYLGAYSKILSLDARAIKLMQQRRRYLGAPDLFYVFEASHAIRYSEIYADWAGDAKTAGAMATRLIKGFAQFVPALPSMNYIWPNAIIPKVHLHEWSQVLAFPQPPAGQTAPLAVWHWARGMAYAGKGNLSAAKSEQAASLAKAAQVPPDELMSEVNARKALAILSDMLTAEIDRHSGQLQQGIQAAESAVTMQAGLHYEEPQFIFPATDVLGSLLLQARRPTEAIQAFQRTLSVYAGYGRAIMGEIAAYKMLGQNKRAGSLRRQFAAAWRIATIPPPDPYNY